MKALIITLALLVSGVCFGQTAKVIQLSDRDAAEAKALYASKSEIEEKIRELQERINENYLRKVVNSNIDCPSGFDLGYLTGFTGPTSLIQHVCYKNGWTGNFQFSEDFRFIVPSSMVPANSLLYPSFVRGVGDTNTAN